MRDVALMNDRRRIVGDWRCIHRKDLPCHLTGLVADSVVRRNG
jgi:hypothetical protein